VMGWSQQGILLVEIMDTAQHSAGDTDLFQLLFLPCSCARTLPA
jgi:hypothetical protein